MFEVLYMTRKQTFSSVYLLANYTNSQTDLNKKQICLFLKFLFDLLYQIPHFPLSQYYKSSMNNTLKLLLGTMGIYVAYLSISILNQKIFTTQYPRIKKSKKLKLDSFQYADLLIGTSALFCAIFSYISSRILKQKENPIPFSQKIRLGILYTLNIATISYSLYYIPYPVRVVMDKLGFLTAVIVGVFFSRISSRSKFKLGKQKIVIAIMVTIGTLIFANAYKVNKQNAKFYEPSQMWIGYILMIISVTSQALFTDNQAYIKVQYKPTVNHLMYSVNFLTFLICYGKLLVKNQLMKSINFCLVHKQISLDILALSLLNVLGQFSIYFTIMNFKQHIFPLISTTRKVFTILLSIYWFNHSWNIWMVFALVMVFGGLIYELVDQLYYDFTGQKKIKVKKGLVDSLAESPDKKRQKND